jgi:hypothetical protein
VPVPPQRPARERLFGVIGGSAKPAPLPGASDSLFGASDNEAHRYVRGIR